MMSSNNGRDFALLLITICSLSTLAFLYEISLLLRKLIRVAEGIEARLTERDGPSTRCEQRKT
jgi:hypothetical protein